MCDHLGTTAEDFSDAMRRLPNKCLLIGVIRQVETVPRTNSLAIQCIWS